MKTKTNALQEGNDRIMDVLASNTDILIGHMNAKSVNGTYVGLDNKTHFEKSLKLAKSRIENNKSKYPNLSRDHAKLQLNSDTFCQIFVIDGKTYHLNNKREFCRILGKHTLVRIGTQEYLQNSYVPVTTIKKSFYSLKLDTFFKTEYLVILQSFKDIPKIYRKEQARKNKEQALYPVQVPVDYPLVKVS